MTIAPRRPSQYWTDKWLWYQKVPEKALKGVAERAGNDQLTGLAWSGEVVQERVARGDGALIHESRAICPVRSRLEHAVPVLIDSVRLRVKGHEQDKFRDIR